MIARFSTGFGSSENVNPRLSNSSTVTFTSCPTKAVRVVIN